MPIYYYFTHILDVYTQISIYIYIYMGTQQYYYNIVYYIIMVSRPASSNNHNIWYLCDIIIYAVFSSGDWSWSFWKFDRQKNCLISTAAAIVQVEVVYTHCARRVIVNARPVSEVWVWCLHNDEMFDVAEESDNNNNILYRSWRKSHPRECYYDNY